MNNSSVSNLRKPLALLGAGLSLFAAQAAFAQPATTADTKDDTVKLDKFVVTGSLIPATLDEQKDGNGSTLYVFDEPTTGLHIHDVKRLVDVFQRLVDRGNSVLFIEHNMDLVAQADWVIDVGPGGGSAGGRIVAEGTPEQVARNKESLTAPYLAEALRGRAP